MAIYTNQQISDELEFVNRNLTLRYPLASSASLIDENSVQLPDSFLADIKINIGIQDRPGSISYKNTLYISCIKVYPDYSYVEISDDYDKVLVGKSEAIDMSCNMSSTIEERTFNILPTSQEVPVVGSIVVGTCEDIAKMQGTHNLLFSGGKLFPSNVFPVSSVLTGFIIDGEYVTGDVTLEPGDGVNFSYDESTNTIKIEVDRTTTEVPITTNQELIDRIDSVYGGPITHVNGIKIENNDLRITGGDCITVTGSGGNALIISNPCGSPCSTDEAFSDIYNRIAELNQNFITINSMYQSVSDAITQMSSRVATAFSSANNKKIFTLS